MKRKISVCLVMDKVLYSRMESKLIQNMAATGKRISVSAFIRKAIAIAVRDSK